MHFSQFLVRFILLIIAWLVSIKSVFRANTKLQEGNTVHIKGVYDKNCSTWIVNNSGGFVVYEPDILVSTTSVVGRFKILLLYNN